jgi:hypothetical protein
MNPPIHIFGIQILTYFFASPLYFALSTLIIFIDLINLLITVQLFVYLHADWAAQWPITKQHKYVDNNNRPNKNKTRTRK